jgi:hypothetical protein
MQEHMFCSEADEDCLQQRKIYLKATMSSAMLFGIFSADIQLSLYLNKKSVLQYWLKKTHLNAYTPNW